jgi:hypothetical protein
MRQCHDCHAEFQDWVSSCLNCSGPLTPVPTRSVNQVFTATSPDSGPNRETGPQKTDWTTRGN